MDSVGRTTVISSLHRHHARLDDYQISMTKETRSIYLAIIIDVSYIFFNHIMKIIISFFVVDREGLVEQKIFG